MRKFLVTIKKVVTTRVVKRVIKWSGLIETPLVWFYKAFKVNSDHFAK